MSLRQNLVLFLSALLALNLHLVLHTIIPPEINSTQSLLFLVLPRIATAYIWVKVYLYTTGENRLNPFVNLAVNLGTPLAAAWLYNRFIRS